MSRINFEDIDFLSPETCVAREFSVQGKLVAFYPLSPRVLPRFQEIATAVFTPLRDLFHKYSDESGTSQTTEEREREGFKQTVFTQVPTSVNLSQEHRKARADQVANLSKSLLHDKALIEVALCILDSCRDLFPNRPEAGWTKQDAQDFLDKVSMPAYFELAMGVVKANMDAFGPFGRKAVQAAVKKAEAAMETKISEDNSDPS